MQQLSLITYHSSLIIMEYLELTTPDDFRAKEIYESYCQSFIEDERRNEKQFQRLFSNPNVKVVAVIDDLQSIGYMMTWELTDFVFVEHLEIFAEHRNKRYATEILNHLFRNYARIVLETEPENDDPNTKRRISFYERNGFAVIDDSYVQPCYEEGKNPLNLLLLANWNPEKTERIKEEIYDVVYC